MLRIIFGQAPDDEDNEEYDEDNEVKNNKGGANVSRETLINKMVEQVKKNLLKKKK